MTAIIEFNMYSSFYTTCVTGLWEEMLIIDTENQDIELTISWFIFSQY
jgi:hypothetical protein